MSRRLLVCCLLVPLAACRFDLTRALEPGELRGRIVRVRPDGTHVAATDAVVRIEGAAVSRTVDGQGRFALRGLAAGTYTLGLHAGDTALRLRGLTLASLGDGVAEGRDLGELVVGALSELNVRVVDGDTPVTGARAILTGFGTATATDGGATFPGLAPGDYELRVARTVDGSETVGNPRVVTLEPGESREERVDLSTDRLFATGTLTGTVRLAGAATHDQVRITLVPPPAGAFEVVSGPDGLFVAPRLPAGVYTVIATHPDHLPAAVPSVAIGGDDDHPTELPLLVLLRADSGCRLTTAETVPADADGDGTPDADEPPACRCDPLSTGDLDADGTCDGLDDDRDGDTFANAADDCPDQPDPQQLDTDGDGAGDACDDDLDGDGVPNTTDVCPAIADPGQADRDDDGTGDACEPRVCFSGWCDVSDRPFHTRVTAVRGRPDDAWLITEAGTLVHFDGHRFSGVLGAAGASPEGFAVDGDGRVWLLSDGLEVLDGGTWRRVQPPPEDAFMNVVASQQGVFAATWGGAFERIQPGDPPTSEPAGYPGQGAPSVTCGDHTVWAGRDGTFYSRGTDGTWTALADLPVSTNAGDYVFACSAVGDAVFFIGNRSGLSFVVHGTTGSWRRDDLTQGGYEGATAASANDAWLFGSQDRPALHWDGTAWRPRASPGFGTNAMHAFADGTLWLASRDGVFRRDGGGWAPIGGFPAGEAPPLDSLWVHSPDEAFATGGGELWRRTTAGGWAPTDPPVLGLGTVTGTTMDDVWVGGYGAAAHFDGDGWTVHAPPELDGRWVRASHAYARGKVVLGANGRTLDYDGSTWRAIVTGEYSDTREVLGLPDGTSFSFTVSGDAPITRWPAGASVAVGEHWPYEGSYGYGVGGVFGTSATDLWGVAQGGFLLHRTDDSGMWSATTVPGLSTQDPVRGLVGTGPTDFYTLGDLLIDGFTRGTFVVHTTGTDWTRFDDSPERMTDLARSPDGTLFAAGDSGVYRHTGAGWTRELVSATPTTYGSVLVRADDDVFVGATLAGASWIQHWDGAAWSKVEVDRPVIDFAVHAGEAWALSSDGARRWTGTGWSLDAPNEGGQVFLSFADGPNGLLAGLRDAPFLARFTGARWVDAASGLSSGVRALATSPGHVWALTDGQGLQHDGGTGFAPAGDLGWAGSIVRMHAVTDGADPWVFLASSGEGGDVARCDLTACRWLESPGMNVADVWADAPDHVVAATVGFSGGSGVIEWDGAAWTAAGFTDGAMQAVDGDAAGHAWLVGDGVLVQGRP